MTNTNPPTLEELYEDELGDPVFRAVEDSWRHGVRVTEVYKRESDNTFWQVHYRRSTDGEYNGLSPNDGDAPEVKQVFPKQVLVTVYE